MFSLATDPVLRHQFAVPLVVVTLAAIDAELQIRHYDEVRKQIIAADWVIVTKSDPEGARRRLRKQPAAHSGVSPTTIAGHLAS